MSPATIVFRRFDVQTYREDIVLSGIKALIDALKVRTAGRSDGKYLYYFGAIVDDSDNFISSLSVEQLLVSSPGEAKVELFIEGPCAA
jgi:hypothetical protein